MSKPVKSTQRFINGIADFQKEGVADSYSFGRCIDHRTDPRSIKLLPRTIKESGTVVTDLPKWADIVGTDTYIYGDEGNIYVRTSAGSYSLLRTVPNSHGNGISYFAEDEFIYYTTDTTIGRYGRISGSSPQFSDDFLGAQGGVPLNTNSLDLEAGSSQYGYRADTASLSITGDLSLEAQIKPESLPTVGNSMTLVSKWNGSGNIRSYKFDMYALSGYFGDGSDGALTISTNTTETPIDSACTGTSGSTSLTATNASFATGQIILIHQSQGSGAGTWMRNKIISYTAGTITLDTALNATYSTGAQVRVLKQYTNVTINSGKTYTAKAWNGTVGGILAFLANGTVTITGSISAAGSKGAETRSTGTYTSALTTGGGFRGAGSRAQASATQTSRGEGISSSSWNNDDYGTSGSGNAGGGAKQTGSGHGGGGGGGGANASVGSNGKRGPYPPDQQVTVGSGATTTTGSADLTTMTFGGGGGGACNDGNNGGGTQEQIGSGGSGGGIIFITGAALTISGSISANGGNGGDAYTANGGSIEYSGGGGGAGGSILLKCQTATLGSSLITAAAGTGGVCTNAGNYKVGGDGSVGRINLDYYTSYTGTTTPTLNYNQDNSLVTNTTYQLRLSVSTTGTALETLAKEFSPTVDIWQHVSVSWDASASTATFFFNGVSLGSQTGTLTAINDNASQFFVGCNKNDSGDAANFYDGLIDEVRVWNTTRTANNFLFGINQQILTTSAGLQGYFKFNADATDDTANSNDLTLSGSPVYSTDVPFPSPTTRVDIDQSATTSGDTFTLATSISEGATSRKTFTPEKDPQKSIGILVANAGSGDWTLTVHDQYNNVIASQTIVAALMSVGYIEFIFDEVWRPIFNEEYHFHITSTVADGTVTTTSNNDLETVSYRTYYQFLVEDTEWHPIARFLEFLVIGNERYIGTYEATLYNPHKITLPAGYRVRCFAYWRDMLAIGVQKGSTITEQDSGRIYFWNGISPTYDYYIDVPEGGINAMLGTKGKLYVIAGYQNDLLEYIGGDAATKLKRIPRITDDKYVETYPGAITMWKTLLRYGIADTDSTDIDTTVYTWGSLNSKYEESLSNDYVISTGNHSTSVTIGLLIVVNRKLLIGWRDNTGCGVDYVDAGNDPFPTGTIEFLIEDDNSMWKEKEALNLVSNFAPLVSGESVDIKYKLDRATNWTLFGATTTADETKARFTIATEGQRYNEIQYAVDLATSTTTSPKIYGIALERDLLKGEERIG